MRRRRVLVGTILLVALGWFGRSGGARPAGTPEAADPGPAASWRLRRALGALPAPEEPDDGPERPIRATEIVVVPLREAADGFLEYPRRPRLEPREFWPALEQVAFPPGDTAPLLEALLAEDQPVGDPLEREFLAAAWDEGIDAEEVDPGDPWAGVLALEVERRKAMVEQHDEYQRALAAGLGPERGQITPDALVGPVDLRAVASLAGRIVDAHPDHQVAEYARLFQLHAASVASDPGTAWSLAVRMLEDTRDPLVLGQAVGLLTNLSRGDRSSGRGPLEPGLLDWVGQLYDDLPEVLDPIDVAAFGLDQAMIADDLGRSRGWIERFEAAVDDLCASEPEGVACTIHTNNLDEAVAFIGDVDVADARDWRQALEIAGYECARQGHDWRARAVWRAEIGWDGAWRWGPWEEGSTSYTDCVEDLLRQAPEPEATALFDVHLSIVR